jgi:hypothetical protein
MRHQPVQAVCVELIHHRDGRRVDGEHPCAIGVAIGTNVRGHLSDDDRVTPTAQASATLAPVSRSRWIIVVLSFAAMLSVSGWIVWSALSQHGRPPVVPLWAHALALALVLVEIASRATKIRWGASALDIPLSFSTALRTCLGGDFASCLTPARTGAEPARFLVLAETRMPAANILMVLFIELLMELTTLVVVGFGLWFFFHSSGAVLGILTTIVAGYAAFVVLVGATGSFLAFRNSSGPPPTWAGRLGLHAGHWRAIQRSLRHLRTSMRALRTASPGWLSAAFCASLVHMLSRLAILPVIVWSVDHTVQLSSLLLWPLILIYGGSVAPAPGGGGAVEFGFHKAFEGSLAPPLLAAALVWWRFYTFYLYILFGALAGGATVMRALRTNATEGPAKTK